MIDYNEDDIREDREHELTQLPEKYGLSIEELRERYQHPIAYSEVMHPAFMLTETVEHYFANSPSVLFDEEAYRHAHNAGTALFNLYQRLGQLRSEMQDAEENNTTESKTE